MEYESLFKAARKAGTALADVEPERLGRILQHAAMLLRGHTPALLEANARDIEAMPASSPMLDRLRLTPERIGSIASDMEAVSHLRSPQGEELARWTRPNGMTIVKRRVPFGVVGMVCEARPNVTADIFALCVKTGNAVILRGGKEAAASNRAIVKVMQTAGYAAGLPEGSLSLVEDTSRESATALMRLNEYLDVIIPRGGAGLIRAVVENATVPAIETGTGNCHVYVDASADLEMAKAIVINAKTQRPSVCNAEEKLLVHQSAAGNFLPDMLRELEARGVEIIGDQRVCALYPGAAPASDEDWAREYLDLKIGVKIVDSLDEAIAHINRYNSGHSEAIITRDYAASQRFLDEIDAAAVYVNASTRFTDGFEFGFGAEIGISTQKIHARGPMGLAELTSTKYIIFGNGQIR